MAIGDVLLFDTHVWIDVVTDRALPRSVRQRIERASPKGLLRISIISIWEIGMLVAKGRIKLGMPTLEWVTESLVGPAIRVAPLETTIAVDSTALPGPFHGDPADRILVATARHLRAVLLTRDTKILAYGSAGHVRVLEA